jgi:hypothetical protein
MPLSSAGHDIMAAFVQEYGYKKGRSVFYAKEAKDKKFRRLIRKGKRKRKRK